MKLSYALTTSDRCFGFTPQQRPELCNSLPTARPPRRSSQSCSPAPRPPACAACAAAFWPAMSPLGRRGAPCLCRTLDSDILMPTPPSDAASSRRGELPAGVIDDEEHVKCLKEDRLHAKEVASPKGRCVSLEERASTRRRLPIPRTTPILCNASGRDPEAKPCQLGLDPPLTP
jgi:hypothetical protein